MIRFNEVGGRPLFINPALVEAVETAEDGPSGNRRAGIKLASGKDYVVDGDPYDVAKKLFSDEVTVRHTGSLGA